MYQESSIIMDSVGQIKDAKVAIVDDNREICSMVSRMVRRLGFRPPIVVHSGEEIVDAVLDSGLSPDVILIDFRLPKMNGIEAAKIIAQRSSDIHIILTTSDESAKPTAAREGFGYLQKPFSLTGLMSSIQGAMHTNGHKELNNFLTD
jgi:CheY-like chemotaxis protein